MRTPDHMRMFHGMAGAKHQRHVPSVALHKTWNGEGGGRRPCHTCGAARFHSTRSPLSSLSSGKLRWNERTAASVPSSCSHVERCDMRTVCACMLVAHAHVSGDTACVTAEG